MKKLFMYLSLLVMPFTLASNKESTKPVLAEEDANATITIGENTFSRVTTSNMDKIKDGAKVMFVTDNPTKGQLIISSSRNSSYSPYGYPIKNIGANQYVFNIKSIDDGYELSMMLGNEKYTLYSPLKSNLTYLYMLNDAELKEKQQVSSAPTYSSSYSLTKGFYGDEENDYPVFTMDILGEIRTIQSYPSWSYNDKNPQALTCFQNSTKKSSYGVASIYVLDEVSEPTNEEKAAAFINKWKAYDDDFCANLKDDTKRAELQTLIDEYDVLDLEVKTLVDAAIIKDDVTIAKQIEYVRNSLAITKSENTSQSLVNIIKTNNSTMTYVLILSIATISLIGYALVLKAKKD